MAIKYLVTPLINRLKRQFERLYGDHSQRCVDRMAMLVGRYGVGFCGRAPEELNEKTAVVSTYPGLVTSPQQCPLDALGCFLRKRLKGAFNVLHLLPFNPCSDSRRYAVADFRSVEPSLGTWGSVQKLAQHWVLLVDVVASHASRDSTWFKDYQGGIAPYRSFFFEADSKADLKNVLRPGSGPVLRSVHTPYGERFVWSTFGADTVDLAWNNPDVLYEILDIILWFLSQGASWVRLVGSPYLWKEVGTSCMYLPPVADIIGLLCDFFSMIAPEVRLVLDAVPYKNGASQGPLCSERPYIAGRAALPVVVFHALLREDSRFLRRYCEHTQAPPAFLWLNQTCTTGEFAPYLLQGLLPEEETAYLLVRVHGAGGCGDGAGQWPFVFPSYDSFLTVWPEEELALPRFLCSQTIPLALGGIPSVFLPTLLNLCGRAPEGTVLPAWDLAELERAIGERRSRVARLMRRFFRLLRIRARHVVFHPAASERFPDCGVSVFACERIAHDGTQALLALSNLSAATVCVPLTRTAVREGGFRTWRDLIRGRDISPRRRKVILQPYQTVWLLGTNIHTASSPQKSDLGAAGEMAEVTRE